MARPKGFLERVAGVEQESGQKHFLKAGLTPEACRAYAGDLRDAGQRVLGRTGVPGATGGPEPAAFVAYEPPGINLNLGEHHGLDLDAVDWQVLQGA